MPPIQNSYRRSFVKIETDGRWSSLKRLGTVNRNGRFKRECSSRAVQPLWTEGLCKKKNVGFAYIAKQSLRNVNMTHFEG